MMTHTKGPWRKSGVNIVDSDNTLICRITPAFHGEQEANARLIAAAPDLLEALEDSYKYFMALDHHEDCEGNYGGKCTCGLSARQRRIGYAIAKTKGKTND